MAPLSSQNPESIVKVPPTLTCSKPGNTPPAYLRVCLMALSVLLLTACALLPSGQKTPQAATTKPKIGLALGGGAARGFAHIGVIKMLESQGIVPDYIVGTSAGAVVGSLYASGHDAMQKIAQQLDEKIFADWTLGGRGFLKGEALQDFINQHLNMRPLEKLNKPFAVVATDLNTGERVVFRTGDSGLAVRASAAVPGIFQPTQFGGKTYVDGGLSSPIPVQAALAEAAAQKLTGLDALAWSWEFPADEDLSVGTGLFLCSNCKS